MPNVNNENGGQHTDNTTAQTQISSALYNQWLSQIRAYSLNSQGLTGIPSLFPASTLNTFPIPQLYCPPIASPLTLQSMPIASQQWSYYNPSILQSSLYTNPLSQNLNGNSFDLTNSSNLINFVKNEIQQQNGTSPNLDKTERQKNDERNGLEYDKKKYKSSNNSRSRNHPHTPDHNQRGKKYSSRSKRSKSPESGNKYKSEDGNNRDKKRKDESNPDTNKRIKKSDLEKLFNLDCLYKRSTPLEPYYKQKLMISDDNKPLNVIEASEQLITIQNKFQRHVLDRADSIRNAKPPFSFPQRPIKFRPHKHQGKLKIFKIYF